jgi:UDP-N-acetylmuramyl tripeptide synthase
MGRIAEEYCAEIILTDEDPYDEDPSQIVSDVAHGMSAKKPEIIMDRRGAIHRALEIARTGDAVLITGKGTDAYIHGAKGRNIPWSDAQFAREELEALLKKRAV